MPGFVSLVGAGPWDPELLTLAGRERLSRADTVIVDYLVNPALLAHCRPEANIVQREVGPHAHLLDQRSVNDLLLEAASRGDYVVRLKGGDPMVFGRGAEEAALLREHGIPFEFVPGVTAAVAAPEAAGIPVTHRDHTPAVSFVSGFEAYEKAGLAVAWEHLARGAGTLVLLMGVRNCRQNAERLIAAGRPAHTPTAVVRWGTRGIQRTVEARLDTIADEVDRAGLRAPAIMIVGDVVSLRAELRWFEDRPLFGSRVVVTRAAERSSALVHALGALGADAVPLPCIEVIPPADPSLLQRALAEFRDPSCDVAAVVVSSVPGVDALCDGLDAAALDLRALAGRTIAAVGPTTAAHARRRGLRPDVVPAAARSEGLVEALRERGLLGRRVLHVRGEEARDVLARAIAEAGGRLDVALGYRTVRPRVSSMLVQSLRPVDDGGEGVDLVTLTSSKAAEAWMNTVREHLGAELGERVLRSTPVVCIGPVTADAVIRLGLNVAAVAPTPDDAGMLSAVREGLGRARESARSTHP